MSMNAENASLPLVRKKNNETFEIISGRQRANAAVSLNGSISAKDVETCELVTLILGPSGEWRRPSSN